MLDSFRGWLCFVWGRCRYVYRAQIDCFQLAFSSRRAVKAEVAEQFAAMRAATSAMRALPTEAAKGERADMAIVLSSHGSFMLPNTPENSLAATLFVNRNHTRLNAKPN